MNRLHLLIATTVALLLPNMVNADPCGMVPPIYTGPGVPIARTGDQNTRGQLLAFSRGETFGYKWTEDGSAKKLPGMLFALGKSRWSIEVPDTVKIEAMILTRDALFAAGPLDRSNRKQKGGVLLSISKNQGRSLGEIPLPVPAVFDGLAAAYGRLYVATEDGKLLCFEGAD